MPHRLLALLIASGALAACSSQRTDTQVFAVTLRADEVIELPRELREVSALAIAGPRRLACVQDEDGVIYEVSLDEGRVVERRRFGPGGDYEGLERVGSEWFVLRSDGMLLRVGAVHGGLAILDEQRLALPHRNLEGLGWDARRGTLLIAPKDLERKSVRPSGKARKRHRKHHRDRLRIYAYDPARGRLLSRPVLDLSRTAIRAEAEALGLLRPAPGRDADTARLALRISAVAVDPRSDEILLLSSVDRVLLRFERSGALTGLEVLDANAIPRPEGLALLASGEMWIASEGQEVGKLYRFSARPRRDAADGSARSGPAGRPSREQPAAGRALE